MDRAQQSARPAYTLRKLVRHTLEHGHRLQHPAAAARDLARPAVLRLRVAALVSVLVLYWIGRIQVAGFTTVVAMLAVLRGAIMLSLGILGEYLGRLHVRSMQRPGLPGPRRTAATSVHRGGAAPWPRRHRSEPTPDERGVGHRRGLARDRGNATRRQEPRRGPVRLTRPYRVGREEEYIAQGARVADVARRR